MNGHINCNTPPFLMEKLPIKNCLRIQVPWQNEKRAAEHEMVK